VTESAEARVRDALAAPRKACIALRQLDFRCRLASDDLRALAWTHWFLRPSFSRTETPAEWQITFLRDDDLFQHLRSAEQSREKRAVRSWVQHAPEIAPSWEYQLGEFRLLSDGEIGVYCAAEPRKREVLIVSTRENGRAHTLLMRVIRELASLEHQRRGAVIYHAAALEEGGGATLALAPKYGGKTTFLMRALLEGANFIANDRAAAYAGKDGMRVVGVPTIVSLRKGTLDLFPAVQSELDRRRLHFWRRAQPPLRADRRTISPSQLCSLTGSAMVADARVAKLLFLVEGDGEAKPLDAAQAAARMQECVFDYAEPERPFFAGLLPVQEEAFRKSVRRLCAEISRQAECWEYPREGSDE